MSYSPSYSSVRFAMLAEQSMVYIMLLNILDKKKKNTHLVTIFHLMLNIEIVSAIS